MQKYTSSLLTVTTLRQLLQSSVQAQTSKLTEVGNILLSSLLGSISNQLQDKLAYTSILIYEKNSINATIDINTKKNFIYSRFKSNTLAIQTELLLDTQ